MFYRLRALYPYCGINKNSRDRQIKAEKFLCAKRHKENTFCIVPFPEKNVKYIRLIFKIQSTYGYIKGRKCRELKKQDVESVRIQETASI